MLNSTLALSHQMRLLNESLPLREVIWMQSNRVKCWASGSLLLLTIVTNPPGPDKSDIQGNPHYPFSVYLHGFLKFYFSLSLVLLNQTYLVHQKLRSWNVEC